MKNASKHRGRPLRNNDVAARQLNMRLTPDEYAEVAAAAAKNFLSPSDFARQTLLKKVTHFVTD